MDYKLYTLVDITHTKQYRYETGKELDRYKEQNFNTIIQTLSIRSNVEFFSNPTIVNVRGKVVGFDTDTIIQVWRFDFSTERDDVYQFEDDPVGFLKHDFDMVPYIQGLDELMEQKYAVFSTNSPGNNIAFYKK